MTMAQPPGSVPHMVIRICIGIDGGGRSTKITFVEAESGSILYESSGEASNPNSVGEKNASKAI